MYSLTGHADWLSRVRAVVASHFPPYLKGQRDAHSGSCTDTASLVLLGRGWARLLIGGFALANLAAL